MASPAHKRAAKLVARYLDPRARWGRRQDEALRELMRADEGARAVYDRAVTAHRLLVGGDPEVPSGFEQARMFAALCEDGSPASSTPYRRWWPALAGAALTALAGALLVFGPGVSPPLDPGSEGPGGVGDSSYTGAKGPEHGGPLVGLGITGVGESGGEYEVVASSEAFLGDYFRFTYSNERPELGYLFIVGLQPGAEAPVWYAPLPDEVESLPAKTGRFIGLDFEIRLAARHRAGPLKVVAIFSPRPVRVADVARAFDASPSRLVPSELQSHLRQALGLSPQAVVQILETEVRPGTSEDAGVRATRPEERP